jgi:LacI family transcriptional regulator
MHRSGFRAVPHKATLDDVARAAGVHRSTVSLSLRDHPRIPEKTRNRVKAFARRLGYRADPLVSSLMQSRRSPHPAARLTLAFLTDGAAERDGSVRLDFFPGAAQRAREFGFDLERFAWDAPVSPRQLSDQLSVRRISGVLADRLPAGVAGPDLEWSRFSCVAFGRPAPPLALHHVSENHFDAVCRAVERCRERGYHRIGFVMAAIPDDPLWVDRSLGAYTMQQLRTAPASRVAVCPGLPATADLFGAWLSREKPDALLVDDPAKVRAWLRQFAGNSSDQLGLVGLQSHRAADCSGFHCDPARTAGLAVEMLLGLMHRKETGLPVSPHEVLVTGTWHEHGTLPPRPATRPSFA